MSLRNIKVPLYDSGGEESSKTLTVNEIAGRITLDIKDKSGGPELYVQCYWKDLGRAWEAVR